MTARAERSTLTQRKVGRASRSLAQLWQVPMFCAGLVALLLMAASAPWRQDPAGSEFEREIATLRRALDDKEIGRGIALAEALLDKAKQYPDRIGEVHFLTGSLYQRLAEKIPGDFELKQKIALHLEQALVLGVPEADLGRLLFRLGRFLHERGSDPKRTVELLARAQEHKIEQPAAGWALLVQAYLKLPNPDLDGALAANQKYLEIVEDMDALNQALLTRAEILLRQENRTTALETLDRVGAKASREIKLKARLLQIRCCEEESRWERAIPLWRELLKEPQQVPGGKGRILYALGLCYRNADQPNEDEAIKAWQEALPLGGDEGQAAGLRLAEVRLFGAKPDPGKALADLARALEKVRSPGDYRNALLEPARAQEIFEHACRHFREVKDFTRLQQVADLYKRIALPGVAEERVAQALEGQARELPVKAASQNAAAPEIQDEARNAYLRAAALYEQSAAARPSGSRAEPLWRSVMCYLPAREFSKIVVILERFVSEEKVDLRLAEAYLIMADAYTALGNKAMALEAYRKCIEIPATPFAYRARYQWAVEEIERKNLTQAEQILKDNLTASGHSVDKEAHEKSLYKLAILAYERQDYGQASLYMKQAVHFYPQNPNQLLVRDQLGDCYRKLAEPWNKKWLTNNKEAGYRRERDRLLELSLSNYQGLIDDLDARSAQQPLPSWETALLRKARFAVADLRFEMQEYPEAIRRYQDLTQVYRRQIGGLVACLRLYQCYGIPFDPQEARRLQNMLRILVQEILADVQTMDPSDEAFTTNREWPRERWLTRLREILNDLNPSPTPTQTMRPVAAPGN